MGVGLLEQQRSRSYSCLPSSSQQSSSNSSSSRARRRENEAWTSTLPLAREKRTVRRLRRAPSQANTISLSLSVFAYVCISVFVFLFIFASAACICIGTLASGALQNFLTTKNLQMPKFTLRYYVDPGKHGGYNCTSKPGADLPRKSPCPHPLILEVGQLCALLQFSF